jgi:hypothetical protein
MAGEGPGASVAEGATQAAPDARLVGLDHAAVGPAGDAEDAMARMGPPEDARRPGARCRSGGAPDGPDDGLESGDAAFEVGGLASRRAREVGENLLRQRSNPIVVHGGLPGGSTPPASGLL